MRGYIHFLFSLLCVFTMSQKYKEIKIVTPSIKTYHKILPYRRELIYELKTCNGASVVLYKKGTDLFTYRILKIPQGSSTMIKMSKYPEASTYLIQALNPLLMCAQFVKFKINWSSDNLTLWTARSTGWNMLFTWNDPSLYTEGFEYVRLYGHPAEWKVYEIEHTEKPFRVTCIKP